MLLPLLQQPKFSRRWYINSIHIVVIGALLLLIILGRWSLVPLRWNHAFFNSNAQVAALGLNPFVWIYDTARFNNVTATKDDLEPYFDTLSLLFGADFPSDSVSSLDR